MIELMPQAFALEMDRSQREAVILQSLLLQIPDVRKVTIDKLYAANLTSLDVMFIASVDEIVQTTGIEKWLAQRIVDRFQAYRHEMKAGGVDATRSGEHDKLTLLASELKTQHAAFEDASAAWMGDAAARRKQMRQARHATLLADQSAPRAARRGRSFAGDRAFAVRAKNHGAREPISNPHAISTYPCSLSL